MGNNFKLYYQQLHLTCLCNLGRYWLRAPWGRHSSVETCSSVIICEIIVHLLVIVQNNWLLRVKFLVEPVVTVAVHRNGQTKCVIKFSLSFLYRLKIWNGVWALEIFAGLLVGRVWEVAKCDSFRFFCLSVCLSPSVRVEQLGSH
jgi:hypothetical protein